MLRTLIFVQMICLVPAFAQNTKKGTEPPSAEDIAKRKQQIKLRMKSFNCGKANGPKNNRSGRLYSRKIWEVSIFPFISWKN